MQAPLRSVQGVRRNDPAVSDGVVVVGGGGNQLSAEDPFKADAAKEYSGAKHRHQHVPPHAPEEAEHHRYSAANAAPLASSTVAKAAPEVPKCPSGDPTLVNLASSSTGSRILFATDEWFATAEHLLLDSSPIFIPDEYCDQGKVMDGWETRRRRDPGHDWCVVQLGSEGRIAGLELDTAHFTGNHAPQVSVEAIRIGRSTEDGACADNGGDDDDDAYLFAWMPGAMARLVRGGGVRGTGKAVTQVQRAEEACRRIARRCSYLNGTWKEVLPRTPLNPGYEETRRHYFAIPCHVRESLGPVTHLRVNYYPDGGVARLRVWGHPSKMTDGGKANGTIDGGSHATAVVSSSNSSGSYNNGRPLVHSHTSSGPPPSTLPYPHPDLACEVNGGIGLSCSNRHYGVPSNLVQPNLGKDMGDGWETARHPDRPAILVRDPETDMIDTALMDWAVLKLGQGGTASGADGGVSRLIIDTRHFRGNYPESVSVEACYVPADTDDNSVCDPSTASARWFPLLKRTKVGPDAEHVYRKDLGHLSNDGRAITHVRVSIFPDGGLSRVRVYGEAAEKASMCKKGNAVDAPAGMEVAAAQRHAGHLRSHL